MTRHQAHADSALDVCADLAPPGADHRVWSPLTGLAALLHGGPARYAPLHTCPTDRALARVELRMTANRRPDDPCKWRAERDRWALSIARSACDQAWVPSPSVRYAFLVVDRLAAVESSRIAANLTQQIQVGTVRRELPARPSSIRSSGSRSVGGTHLTAV